METVKRKLLLVDDDPSLLETLGDFLRFEGYNVQCATSGEDALVKMRPFQPDLIILDMSMPGMGGKGFLDRITNPEDGQTLYPVMVLTARAAMAEYFADKKIAGFIAKPCDPPDLLLEVGRILFETSNATPTFQQKTLRRVVVADGDPEFLKTLEEQFSQSGFEVVSVPGGAEALESCITYIPAALVMRLECPGMSADEVVATLKRLPHCKNIPVIVYGMDLPEAELNHVANLMIPEQCMLKDLSVDKLIDRVMAVTGSK